MLGRYTKLLSPRCTWHAWGMNEEIIESMNQPLPDTPSGRERRKEKGQWQKEWIESVIDRIGHYGTNLSTDCYIMRPKKRYRQKARIDKEGARKEHRVTFGANIVIKNVLPFLA